MYTHIHIHIDTHIYDKYTHAYPNIDTCITHTYTNVYTHTHAQTYR